MDVLLDTNAVLRHFADGFLVDVPKDTRFFVSVITEAELLRLSGVSDAEMTLIDRFLETCVSLPIDSVVARSAAHLGRTRKTKLPDLFIAATAIRYHLTLITFNVRDFRGIPGLLLRSEL